MELLPFSTSCFPSLLTSALPAAAWRRRRTSHTAPTARTAGEPAVTWREGGSVNGVSACNLALLRRAVQDAPSRSPLRYPTSPDAPTTEPTTAPAITPASVPPPLDSPGQGGSSVTVTTPVAVRLRPNSLGETGNCAWGGKEGEGCRAGSGVEPCRTAERTQRAPASCSTQPCGGDASPRHTRPHCLGTAPPALAAHRTRTALGLRGMGCKHGKGQVSVAVECRAALRVRWLHPARSRHRGPPT